MPEKRDIPVTLKTALGSLLQQEDLNFALTNRIPRKLLTRFMGWFSRIEHPLVSRPSLWAFQFFADDLNLVEARKKTFKSLHECFIRELKEGARPVDPDEATLVSPCDAIVGASGRIEGGQLIQAKGMTYTLQDLLLDEQLVRTYTDGTYVTLRLKANMYHRFHAPHDGRVEQVAFILGDLWNVNPIALKRVERLYARNERAVIQMRLLKSRPTDHAGPDRCDCRGEPAFRVHRSPASPRLPRAESDSLRRRPAEGSGDGSVRTGIHHHRLRANRL